MNRHERRRAAALARADRPRPTFVWRLDDTGAVVCMGRIGPPMRRSEWAGRGAIAVCEDGAAPEAMARTP